MRISQMFTRRMREERERRGWSQAELSRRVTALGHKLDKTAVSKIESGQRKVTLEDAVALAAALDVPPSALLFTNEDGELALTDRLSVRMPFAAGWLTGVMPRTRADVQRYQDAGDLLILGMRIEREIPRLVADLNEHEAEMVRAYVAERRLRATWLDDAAIRLRDDAATHAQDAAREHREEADQIERLLPKEKK